MTSTPPYGAPRPPQDHTAGTPYGPPSSGQPSYGQPSYGQPSYGQPSSGRPSYGQPTYGQPPAYGTPPVAGYGYRAVTQDHAGWGLRVAASLLDGLVTVPALVVIGGGFAMMAASSTVTSDPVTGAAVPELTGSGVTAGVLVIVLGYALAIALTVWNRVFRAGRTGQSWGKKVVGIRMVGEQSGQPVGAGLAFGRELAHTLDGAFYIGYLWPLWDARRQTFADKVCSTVVVHQR